MGARSRRHKHPDEPCWLRWPGGEHASNCSFARRNQPSATYRCSLSRDACGACCRDTASSRPREACKEKAWKTTYQEQATATANANAKCYRNCCRTTRKLAERHGCSSGDGLSQG